MDFDVSDPGSPLLVGQADTPGNSKGVAVSSDLNNRTAYVADNQSGLQVIDIFDPANPVIVGSSSTPGFATDVFFANGSLFVANDECGVLMFDVSDPATPRAAGGFDTPGLAIGVVAAGPYLYVADYSYELQIFPGQCDYVTAVEPELPVRDGQGLSVYPNPFNPRTMIGFECKEPGPVQLTVHDLAGRRVVCLVDEWLEAGLRSFPWNGRDTGGRPVAAGQYLVRLKTRFGVEVRKVILAK